ncbi:MAG TPA: GntR family transcriptional regulator YhfZ [Selenomonadales bacterium]|nr:GntR family transcriptional regulator YhfZ [Selenomonadales bacterium]
MNIQAHILQKNGLVAIKLARELMTLKTGDRLSTIEEYSQKYSAARGTVQAALKLLGQYKAIALEPRGHLGTFITGVDYEVLWEFTGLGTIMGVMPLPYSRRYEGLATGLYQVLGSRRIPFSLAYMRGAETRLSALKSGRYDLAIVSRLAAAAAIERGQEIDIAIEFGRYTYVNQHVILFSDTAKREIEDGMAVGVDRTSIDHHLLTLSQCAGKRVNLVDLAYNQIISKLQAREIDAAVWNIDEILERQIDIPYYSLRSDEFADCDTEAVAVVNRQNDGLRNLLSAFVDKEEVVTCQQQVVRGERIPNY